MMGLKTWAVMVGLVLTLAWVGGTTQSQVGAHQKGGVTVTGGERSGTPTRHERRRIEKPINDEAEQVEPAERVESIDREARTPTESQDKPDARGGTIMWYVFGGSGRESPGMNRRLVRCGSWQAWAEDAIDELPEGCTRVWLHNPFGIYEKRTDDRMMWIDQWVLAQEVLPGHMTDPEAFAAAVQMLRDAGVTEIVAYVGSPQTLEDQSYEHVETLLRPMLAAGCSMAFDATYDWEKGDETDQLIQELRTRGHRVYVEPWLFDDREYGEIDGIVHADRFFPRNVMRGHPLEDELPCERVVIQLTYTAEALEQMREEGATLAVRSWTQIGRELIEE